MNRQSRSKMGSVARSVAGWLLLCALLLRGVIPGGYMPNFTLDQSRGFLVICSGSTVAVPSGQDDTHAPADTHQNGLCAFAMLGGFVPLLALAVLLLWGLLHAARRQMPPVMRHLCQIVCAPPGARAPPAFV